MKDAKLQTKITKLQSRIQHHEQCVDELVYKLYNLTAEDIALVHTATV
ncbi:MAG TPA: hypothetical protein VEY71_10050 [Chitinophagales bacterium]|nr:hypothetical protein [Chitinophagales bacterium]